MKKIISFLCVLLLLLSALFAAGCARTESTGDILRIHIRADSNDPSDQAVKLKVRDAVVTYLTPILFDLPSFESAKKAVESRLTELKDLAESVLKTNGFSYGAKVAVRREKFPTKTYGDLTLLAGVYEAIVFELGSGTGDNWWCVAYPSLCFVPHTDEVVYRSKIKEIIEKWRSHAK